MSDETFADLTASTPPAFSTPWEPTREDWEREGHWADFVAWERWMGATLESQLPDHAFLAWESMDMLARIGFYSLMVDCCQHAAGGER